MPCHALSTAFAQIAPGGALDAGSSAYLPYPAYQLDLGYESAGLKALLYVLAISEPGTIYLASLSRKSGGSIPGLSRHYHVAVLAPYFEESGEFKVAAFESDVETSVEAIMARVPKDFVHLVGIKVGRDYDPPALPEYYRRFPMPLAPSDRHRGRFRRTGRVTPSHKIPQATSHELYACTRGWRAAWPLRTRCGQARA